jgi:hypothetical protein
MLSSTCTKCSQRLPIRILYSKPLWCARIPLCSQSGPFTLQLPGPNSQNIRSKRARSRTSTITSGKRRPQEESERGGVSRDSQEEGRGACSDSRDQGADTLLSHTTREHAPDSFIPQMDDMIQEKVSQKENELNATYDEKMRNYEERSVSPQVPARLLLRSPPANKTFSVRSLSQRLSSTIFACPMTQHKPNCWITASAKTMNWSPNSQRRT